MCFCCNTSSDMLGNSMPFLHWSPINWTVACSRDYWVLCLSIVELACNNTRMFINHTDTSFSFTGYHHCSNAWLIIVSLKTWDRCWFSPSRRVIQFGLFILTEAWVEILRCSSVQDVVLSNDTMKKMNIRLNEHHVRRTCIQSIPAKVETMRLNSNTHDLDQVQSAYSEHEINTSFSVKSFSARTRFNQLA